MRQAAWAVVLAGFALWSPAALGDEVRLECTADNSICIFSQEQNYNQGGKPRLRIKGNEHILLMKFDLGPMVGRGATSARLWFCPAGPVKLKVMGLSTVRTDWIEGTSNGLAKAGEPTYLEAGRSRRSWGPDKTSTFLWAAFSPWQPECWYREVRAEKDGWLSVDVSAELVNAMVRGESFGLGMSDEKGQTGANNDIFAREQRGKGAYLVVERSATKPPAAPLRKEPTTSSNESAARSRDRETRLNVGRPGPRVRSAEWAEDGGLWYRVEPLWAQVDPVGARPHFRGGEAGQVWDGRRAHVEAGRNWFAGVQVIVDPGDGVVAATAMRDDAGRELAGWSRANPVWFIRGQGERRWLADPLVPENTAGAAAGYDRAGIRATYVEWYVDDTAAPGTYRGTIELRRAGGEVAAAIPVELVVHKATLPDVPVFKVSLNTYGSPGGKHGKAYPSKEFLTEELAWHRMAHEHRATIAVVPYSQRGQVEGGMAPELTIDASGGVKADWSAWDRRWEPYFAGEAFKGLPRDGVPLDHFYLPMHENWPLEIEKHYKWAGDWATHWERAGPIEEGFDSRYQAAWQNASRAFAEHIKAKGWNGTLFQAYLNNKYYFKQKGVERGSSYWLLDEPMHRDDFRALEFFGEMFVEGVREAGDPPNVVYRVDLSRPQWDRGYLAKVTGLCVCSAWPDWGSLGTRYRRTWSYGQAPSPEQAMTEQWRWLVEAWAAGCDGMVPWQSIGRQDSWDVCEGTSILYPSRPGMADGPVASLRLKALRAAEQDIELLHMMLARAGRDTGDASERMDLVEKAMGRGPRWMRGIEDGTAVSVDLSGVGAGEILDLRTRLLRALDE